MKLKKIKVSSILKSKIRNRLIKKLNRVSYAKKYIKSESLRLKTGWETRKIKEHRLSLFDLMAMYYTSTKYLILSVLLLIPTLIILAEHQFSWYWLLQISPLEFVCIFTIVRFFLYIKDTTSFKLWAEDMKKNPDHATIYAGAPGMGKTFTAVFATYYMAIGSWIKLQWEFFKLLHKAQALNLKPEDLTDKDKEVYDAYQYMITHKGIPCLGTNIEIYSKRYKRYSYKIGPAYLKQLRRAPYRFVGLYDEIGTVFNFELSNDKADKQRGLSTSDYARFCRQFTEMRFIGTEQNGCNMYKGIRNVVARYREYTEFTTIFKPKFLTWIFDTLQAHFIKNMSMQASKRWGGFMAKFEEFLSKTGYVRVRYRDMGHNDTPIEDKSGKGVLYFPCCSEFEYDTRAFRFAYEVRNMPLKLEVFDGQGLTPKEAQAFLRANYPKVKEEEKKVA